MSACARRLARGVRVLALGLLVLARAAGAEEGVTRERIEALERRIAELEAERDERRRREE